MSNPQSKFRVIEGGMQPAPAWLNLRPQVLARSPFDRSPVSFRLSKLQLQKLIGVRRTQPIFDAWSMIVGEPPPINNIHRWDDKLQICPLASLADATACFRGLKRPVGEDDRGWDAVAYVVQPSWYFAYKPAMACVAELVRVPADLVFVAYVRLDQPFGNENPRYSRNHAGGVITHWHFVEGESKTGSGLLPVNATERYRTRLW